MPKRDVKEDLERFITEWVKKNLPPMMDYMISIANLWGYPEENDPLKEELGLEKVDVHRIILTAYLISRFAESYAGTLVSFKIEYKDLWKRLEKASLLPDDSTEFV